MLNLTHFPYPVILINEDLQVLSVSRQCLPLIEVPKNVTAEKAREHVYNTLKNNKYFNEKINTAITNLIDFEQSAEEELLLNIRGEERYFEVTVSLHKKIKQKEYYILLREITEEKASREILDQTRSYLESIINSIPLGIVVTNKSGQVTSWNNFQEQLFEQIGQKMSIVDIIGKKIEDIMPPSIKEELEAIYTMVLRQNKPYNLNQVQLTVEGGEDCFLDISAIPITKNGSPVGLIQVMEEVTNQVNIEKQLIKSEKLALIGQIAVTMNHEINNPLTSIIGNCQCLLFKSDELDEDITIRLKKIEDNAKRIGAITEKLNRLKVIRSKPYLTDAIKMLDLD